jgi:alpha-tubulin suppressor-like RCC1 family protein
MKKNLFLLIAFLTTLNNYGQCFTKANAGAFNGFGVKPNGTIWGWGNGVNGQLNNGTNFDEYEPIQLATTSDWSYISNGNGDTFAIKTNGTLWATGYNVYGSLGIGSTALGSDVFVQVGTATNWKEIAASSSQTIGIRTDNTIWGWGQNDFYQTGIGTCCANVLSPVQIGTANDWKMVAVSKVRSSFALKNNGTLWAWGGNNSFLLGDSSVSVWQTPTQRFPDTDWKTISAGFAHVLALKTNGTLWAWGNAGDGERGIDPNSSYVNSVPNQIPGNWKEISAELRFSIGIKTDGTLWAWGKNDYGQLGNGTTINTFTPTQIGTDSNWATVSAGRYHVVAMKTNGGVYTWGDNTYAQLGNGTATSTISPGLLNIAGCTLATNEFATIQNNVVLSPNPTSSEVRIRYQGTATVNTIVIYDIMGRVVHKEQPLAANSFSAVLNISSLEKGTYVVVLKNNESAVVSKKLVKE